MSVTSENMDYILVKGVDTNPIQPYNHHIKTKTTPEQQNGKHGFFRLRTGW